VEFEYVEENGGIKKEEKMKVKCMMIRSIKL
jgi:hypothetical protein